MPPGRDVSGIEVFGELPPSAAKRTEARRITQGTPGVAGGALGALAPKSKGVSRTRNHSQSDHHHTPEGLGGGMTGRRGARRDRGTGLGMEG